MNKRTIYRVAVAFLLGGTTLASCDDYLDKTPDNRTTIDSEDKITSLLVSAYPETNFAYICEMYSDNIDREDVATYTTYEKLEDEAALWKDITYEDTDSPQELWDASYMAIATANQALALIEEMGNPSSLNGEKAEALMCRAYNHWVLTNVFCKNYNPNTSSKDLGVKYSVEPETVLSSPEMDRGTVAEDYEKIDRDIQEALPLLNDNHLTVPKYHFSKKAAYAFAARFYLFYGDYDRAIKYATTALGSNPTTVLRDWETIGNKAINGNVRAMAYIDSSDPANFMLISTQSVWYRVYGPYSVGYKYCHDNFIANNETCAQTPWGTKGDLYFWVPQYPQMPKVIMAKTPEYFEYTDVVQGIGFAHEMYPVLTADETLLVRAEAYILKGEYDNGAADLNLWGTRFYEGASSKTSDQIANFYAKLDYYTPENPTPKKVLNPEGFTVTPGKQENMIHAVLAARRILLLHEGFRWFDVKRYGIEIYRRSIKNNAVNEIIDFMSKDDNRRAIQLPQTVIYAGVEANPR
jgi:tetratricopeptide (TPR) repeat protein